MRSFSRDTGETAVTNNTDKQSRERITIVEGKMPVELLVPDDPSKELPIVEKLRKDFGARGEVVGAPRYEKESESFGVVFKAPGYLATATIRAADGQTKVTHQSRGINGIFLDLHRGKDSGIEWSFIVDAVAILFVIVSVTGFILWSSLRGRAAAWVRRSRRRGSSLASQFILYGCRANARLGSPRNVWIPRNGYNRATKEAPCNQNRCRNSRPIRAFRQGRGSASFCKKRSPANT